MFIRMAPVDLCITSQNIIWEASSPTISLSIELNFKLYVRRGRGGGGGGVEVKEEGGGREGRGDWVTLAFLMMWWQCWNAAIQCLIFDSNQCHSPFSLLKIRKNHHCLEIYRTSASALYRDENYATLSRGLPSCLSLGWLTCILTYLQTDTANSCIDIEILRTRRWKKAAIKIDLQKLAPVSVISAHWNPEWFPPRLPFFSFPNEVFSCEVIFCLYLLLLAALIRGQHWGHVITLDQ